MRYSEKVFRRLLISGFAASLLLSAAAFPPAAGAWSSRSWSGRSYYYGSSNVRRLQRDAQADAAERRREVAREKRRTEIEGQVRQFEKDFLASQAEIRSTSQAASAAPRDYFYRKPGTVMSTLPSTAVEIKVEEQTYHYFSGIFFRQLPAGFIVVPAPVGAVVDKLPDGVSGASFKGDLDKYRYYFGTFFTAEGDKYKVVQPPAETVVGYVPDGYTEMEVGGSPRLQFGDITYAPVFLQDSLLFQVVQG